VSDLSQSSALQGLSADTAAPPAWSTTRASRPQRLLPSFEMRQDARQQAVIGQGQAAEAKRTSDLNTGLQQLSDQRFKVLAAKASGHFKTYFDSLNQQVDIANSNRNYGAAADKLGLDQQKFQLDQTKASRDYKLKSKTLRPRRRPTTRPSSRSATRRSRRRQGQKARRPRAQARARQGEGRRAVASGRC
jgi:hypothetical protein